MLWAMMTFPGLPESQTSLFEQKRAALLDSVPSSVVNEVDSAEEETGLSPGAAELKDQLSAIDSQEAESALRHSIAGRVGTALEGLTTLVRGGLNRTKQKEE